ncbi:Alanine racemase [Propionibacterium ruminifibrarum]|uniref:Alanine racemase n=1 Tax=Propionibacterium ruminifibrarum TaxID=1962131 RepID=A0A375I2B5_9ACTN|nr:alanine racemase [Propionibacterium ruminifibrarum]SPF67809.1 Alanine racemase [Propionibacterium ruminifibrarum]
MLYATHAEISLRALAANARALRERAAGRKVLAAVKANAYGHGAVNVAHTLERGHLVDWFGVATVPEGIELRDAGISLPILKLSHSFPEELEEQLASGITPTVVDSASAALVARVAGDMGRVKVHLAVDTGMGRIGCAPDDALTVARRIDELGLVLEGVFTHLPISDTPEGHDFTVGQLRRFNDTVAAIQADRATRDLPPVPLIHGAASAALLGHDLTGLTMVRPGVAMYGMYPDPATPKTVDLEPVMSLYSRVSMIKHVPAGTTIGYGRTWRAPTNRWIATVPIGYGDGFNRLNSNTGRMLINGRSFPIAGRVCMDQTMLDLGERDDHGVRPGNKVTVLGADGDQRITADELAERARTINYEVTTSLGSRVLKMPY